jgi:hypothetical protein
MTKPKAIVCGLIAVVLLGAAAGSVAAARTFGGPTIPGPATAPAPADHPGTPRTGDTPDGPGDIPEGPGQ